MPKSLDESAEPGPGARVGEFVLEEPLGHGGFATVWRAHHHVWTDRLVAVKLLRDRSEVDLLRTEAACLAHLTHPGITRALALDLDGAFPYLVVELHEGQTLRELLRAETALSPERARRVFTQIVEALAHSHEQGVAHGDLKPENILLDAAGRVKLTDFGLGRGRATEASLLLSGDLPSEATRLGGTIPYMAPEQRDGHPPDPTSDVFALGILLFELLTGRRPHPGDDPREHLSDAPGWISVWELCFTRRDRRLKDARAVAARLGMPATGTDAPLPPVVTTPSPPVASRLDEIERAVAQELGITLSELRAPEPAKGGVSAWVLSWVEDAWHSDTRRVQEGRRLVWYLGQVLARAGTAELARRYQVSEAEVQLGLDEVAEGRADPTTWRALVERLAPLPEAVRLRVDRTERKQAGWRRVSAFALLASVSEAIFGLTLMASGGALLPAGLGLLGLLVPSVWLGISAVRRARTLGEQFIDRNLPELPGADREARLTVLALHTNLAMLSQAARRELVAAYAQVTQADAVTIEPTPAARPPERSTRRSPLEEWRQVQPKRSLEKGAELAAPPAIEPTPEVPQPQAPRPPRRPSIEAIVDRDLKERERPSRIAPPRLEQLE